MTLRHPILYFLFVTAVCLGETPEDRSVLSVDRIFKKKDFKQETWGPARWLEDGSGYTTLEPSLTVGDAKDIVRYAPESGQREVLVPASALIPVGETKPLEIQDYAWSVDLKKLLIFTKTKRVWRQETRGDYWVLDRASGSLKKLGGIVAPSTLMFASFSPDGRHVAYVRENNLYVQSLESFRIKALTHDGSASRINGTADWVYEEEFGLRKGFRWSPDGLSIAYWQFDTTGVPTYSLINNTDKLYPEVSTYAYPKVGETNSSVRVGIVKASGGRTRWFKPNSDARNHYIPEMEWAPDSKSVIFQHLNRLQNTNQVIRGDARSGVSRPVFQDRDAAWVDVVDAWHWLETGKRFLWLSERDGWNHLYSVDAGSGQVALLTPGAFDVVRMVGLGPEGGGTTRRWVYFIASPDNPTQRYLYRTTTDGQGGVERLSPGDQPGTHAYDLSKDGRWAFHTYSRFGQPPVVDLVSLPDHRSIRKMAENLELTQRVADLKPCPGEFFRVDIGDGVRLDAWCLKPPQFDPAKRYPLLLYVYGEPAGSTVVDAWGSETYLWHRLMAQQGYVVMSIDNRGTATPRGRAWRKSIYRQIGVLASADQAAALRQILRERPYIDPARVGIWGWSGGGSMSLNAIFRYPDLYRTAMAIAFVSDQRLYDTIYQERYMGLPKDNAEGFKAGSPITHAHQLKGNLLLIYGTGDDNCHFQNCERLANELIKHGRPFSQVLYPNRTHSISEGENTRPHLYQTLQRYAEETLPR
jgi:dipeptidyl-peptidase-4